MRETSGIFSYAVQLSFLLVVAYGEKARRSAPSSHTVRDYCGKLAGKSHPEGVAEGLLPGTSGHALPGRWTGSKTNLKDLIVCSAEVSSACQLIRSVLV